MFWPGWSKSRFEPDSEWSHIKLKRTWEAFFSYSWTVWSN